MFASLGGQPPAAQRLNGTGTEPRLGANGLGLKRLQCHFGSWENDGTTLQNPWKNTKSWENDEKKMRNGENDAKMIEPQLSF